LATSSFSVSSFRTLADFVEVPVKLDLAKTSTPNIVSSMQFKNLLSPSAFLGMSRKYDDCFALNETPQGKTSSPLDYKKRNCYFISRFFKKSVTDKQQSRAKKNFFVGFDLTRTAGELCVTYLNRTFNAFEHMLVFKLP
jgi:hypothetical protein